MGGLAVIIGAFAAHGLEKLISIDAQQTFETGARYQMYHALFLILVGQISPISEPFKKRLATVVLAGVIFFSGSIYLLATNSLTTFDFRIIGFITPIGGLLLIISWIVLGYRVFKIKT